MLFQLQLLLTKLGRSSYAHRNYFAIANFLSAQCCGTPYFRAIGYSGDLRPVAMTTNLATKRHDVRRWMFQSERNRTRPNSACNAFIPVIQIFYL